MKSRKLSLFLAILMLTMSFTACGETAPETVQATTEQITEDTTPVTELKIGMDRADLPAQDYDGAEFVFWGGVASDPKQAWQALDAEGQTGEVLNDAIFNRNSKIEDTFDVNISTVALGTKDSNTTVITQTINANDDSYDAIFWRADLLLNLSRNRYFVNYYDMPHIDVEADWWDQSIVEGFTVCDQLYLCTGDISPYTNARVFSIVFNKDMCKELGLELPYSYVFDGSWTLDRFNYYISNVNNDTNGDGKMDYDDRWGFMAQNGCSWMMFFSGGGRLTDTIDGIPTLSYSNERNVNLASTAIQIASDPSKTIMGDSMAKSTSWQAVSDWFANEGSLLRASVFEPVPRDYRNMEADFGVLPFPKLDEAQENYYTLPSTSSLMISFPITCDTEFSSLIVEALAAESTHTVTEAFYENCLNEKSVRDEESQRILKIIFDNKCVDVGYFLDVGAFQGSMQKLESAGNSDVMSTFVKIKSAAEKKLNDFVNDYKSMKENAS